MRLLIVVRKIQTRDGSFTFKNETYGESYHCTTVGALEEARIKYAEPADIKKGDVILDFCFGLGYNTLAALKICNDITVTALELDEEILSEIPSLEVPKGYEAQQELICKAVSNANNDILDEKINIILGDASKEIELLDNDTFNAILFDPFSPRKHEELWSLDVFKQCYRVMKKGGKLTTYSCARWIRDNMREAGFEVIDGPIFGRRSSSTIAIKR